MLLDKIQRHNVVNGFRFSAAEFTLIALAVGPFSAYYFWHGRFTSGTIALGIVANMMTVVFVAIRSIVANEDSIGVLRWFDSAGRAEIAHRYPGLTQETLILTVSLLIPFAVPVVTLYEAGRIAVNRR